MEDIWLYTAETWSVEQADRYLNLLFDEMEYLCSNPGSALDFGFIRTGYLRSRVKSHFIFFRIDEKKDVLVVIRILHQRMDVEPRMTEK